MPESKRPLKVFLCHAHADRDPVRGRVVRQSQTSPRTGLGIGDSQGCARDN